MIIRKPYAFMIKHFKLLHLIILACIIFAIYNLSGIGALVNTLLSSRTYTYSGADIYINKSIYLFIFVALFLSVGLFWLLRQKRKPVGLYVGLMVYLVVLIVSFMYMYGVLNTLINETVEVDTIAFLRDFLVLLEAPGYVFSAICFVRGIGFNIKQFNFSKDIEELKIADKDSEEFEIMVGQNNYKYMRTLRRTIREGRYYVLENLVAITIVFGVLLIILGFFGFRYYQQYVKKVKSQQVSNVNGITYVINNAYITAEDYNGAKVKEGSKFVVIDMSFHNTSNDDKKLNLESIQLINNQLIYLSTQSYNSKFIDLGIPYERDTLIPKDEMFDRTLVFEIPETTITTHFDLRVEYGVSSKNKKVISNFVKFDVNAKNIDTDDTTTKFEYNHEVNTNVIDENPFDFTIRGFNLQENYNSKYVLCDKKLKCQKYNNLVSANAYNKKTMLVVDFKGKIHEDAKFTKTLNTYNKVFSNYTYLEYSVYNTRMFEKVEIVPQSDVEDKLFFLVDRKILESNYINLTFQFRNNTYVIALKG